MNKINCFLQLNWSDINSYSIIKFVDLARDHAFKTSAFVRGRGGQKLVKFADGRDQKLGKFADVLNRLSTILKIFKIISYRALKLMYLLSILKS